MATQKTPVSSAWKAVAAGPGNASFAFHDHPGEWTIHSGVSNAGIVAGFRQQADTPQSLTLASGEYLHLRGRSTALVTADVPVA